MNAVVSIAGKTVEVPVGGTIENAVRDAGYLPDAYLFIVDGKPVPMDTAITDGMLVKALKVASGG